MKKPLLSEIYDNDAKHVSREKEATSEAQTDVIIDDGRSNEESHHSILIRPVFEIADQYDYCMVLPKGEDHYFTKKGRNIVNKLRLLDFEIFPFNSRDDKEIYLLLRLAHLHVMLQVIRVYYHRCRLPLEKLRHFADKIDFQMRLDPHVAKEQMEAGDASANIRPVIIPHRPDVTKYEPYEYIYGRYCQHIPEILYKKQYPADTHPFRDSIRLKLIALLLESIPPDQSEPIKLRRYIANGDISACFPLHSPVDLEILRKKWLPLHVLPWHIPAVSIREYYSEKTALYFCFVGHFSKWLIFPSIVGLPMQVAVVAIDNFSAPFIPAFSFIVSVWAIVTLEFWKRTESTLALKWGMTRFEETETDRSEFKGSLMTSYITGEQIKFFPREKHVLYVIHSLSAIFGTIALVIGVVVGIYITRFALVKDGLSDTDAQTVASVLNAIQIQIMNYLYSFVAIALSNYENHRTDTQYEDSLIFKVFLFQFVNSYASFYYIAFIAEPIGECSSDTCMQSLATNLLIIILSRIATSIFTQQIMPYLSFKYYHEKEFLLHGDKMVRPERERFLLPYDTRISQIGEYIYIAIQFGYMALFASALPIAPLFVLISNFIEAKGDAWKLLYTYQRPFPYGCQDIGTWQTIYFFIVVIAIVTNGAMTVFTMSTFDDLGNVAKFWIFVVFQWICFTFQYICMVAIPDESHHVFIQKQRQEFIVGKLIDKEAHDIIPEFDLDSISDKLTIHEYPERNTVPEKYRQSIEKLKADIEIHGLAKDEISSD